MSDQLINQSTEEISSSTAETSQQVANTGVGTQGATSSVGTTTLQGEVTTIESTNKSFSDQIPEEFKNEASLSNIKDMNSLVKGYVHAQKEIGARVRIPGPDASDEVKAEFAKKMEAAGFGPTPNLNDEKTRNEILGKMGRPETPDGYDATIPEEVGALVNPEQLKGYRELAHQIGLTKSQAKALLEYDINRTMGAMEGGKDIAASTLKQEWGDAFDMRLEAAKEGLAHFGKKYPDAVAAIKNGPAGNNPVVLMMASELGKLYKESGIVVGNRSVSFGLTPTEARVRIDEVMGNTKHAYHNDSDPNHWAAVEEVEKLYAAAYPDSGQSS